ncbi:MAG: hypothetical protein CMP59_12305 [Flavobacteriales bacterium]|nr:hypothetical protein [Flavobacteriales bacterium]|tara:strand:+ start:547 stop:1599 length:1053 start_codon:yes stop_codon:yes gene_type:complete
MKNSHHIIPSSVHQKWSKQPLLIKPLLIAINCLLFLSNLSAQELNIVTTEEILEISNDYGLDSALQSTRGIPVWLLDTNSSIELFKDILENEDSYEIESFLIDFAVNIETDLIDIGEIINKYYQRKYNAYSSEIPLQYGCCLPKLRENSLFILLKYKTVNTEEILIKYYELWKSKVIEYKSDYEIGLLETSNRKKELLTTNFIRANENCNQYLLALKEVRSAHYNFLKMEYHNSFLSEYSKSSEDSHIYLKNDFFRDFEGPAFDTTEIILEEKVNSLKDLNELSDPELKNFFERYSNDKSCWKFLFINGNEGFLDVGCQYGPLAGGGSHYRIKLINGRKLFLYRITTWMS